MPLSAPLLEIDHINRAQKLQSADNKSFIIVIIRRSSFSGLHHLFHPLSVAERSVFYAAFMLSGRVWKGGRAHRRNSAANSLKQAKEKRGALSPYPPPPLAQDAALSCVCRRPLFSATLRGSDVQRQRPDVGQKWRLKACWRVGRRCRGGVMWFVRARRPYFHTCGAAVRERTDLLVVANKSR